VTATDPTGRCHRFALRVYYEDTDAGGVVYHANYLRFAERARTEALRDLGVPHAVMFAEHGVIFMVRRVKTDYLAPARLDESLVVATRALAVNAASVVLRQSVERAADGVELAVLEVLLACVRIDGMKPARIPRPWRAAMLRLSDARMNEAGPAV
jgi:acyl-CoA thioester hydrolase